MLVANRQRSRCVRRTVEWINYGDKFSIAHRPDSSPAQRAQHLKHRRAAESATRSLAYCPSRPPESPQSSCPSNEATTASTASCTTASNSSSVTALNHARPFPPGTSLVRTPRRMRRKSWQADAVAVIDLQGFVADLKDHVAEHGFHVHDERHFIETYTNRQTWEIDLHPDQACDGPLDLHVAIEVDPRTLIAFEDEVALRGETGEPDSSIVFPVTFSFALPPLPASPDLLILATDLAGIGGTVLPLDVSAVDSFAAVTDAADRAIAISGHVDIPRADLPRTGSPVRRPRRVPAWPSSCSTARLFGSTTPSTEPPLLAERQASDFSVSRASRASSAWVSMLVSLRITFTKRRSVS